MNGRSFFAGVTMTAAVAATLVMTTTNLRADSIPPADEVGQLRTRIAALEAEVKSLRAELKSIKVDSRPDFRSFKFDDKDFKPEIKVNINGKEYVLPRDREKLQKEQPNMKFGEGTFGLGGDGSKFKFEMPEMKFEGTDGTVYILPRDLEKLKSDPNFNFHRFEGKDFEMSKEMKEAMQKAREEMRKAMKEFRDAQSEKSKVAPTSV